MKSKKKIIRWGGAAGLVASGLVAGGVLASSLTASAADSTTSANTTSSSAPSAAGRPAAPPNAGDQSKSQRPDEHLLTGTTKAKVIAAALAKYPGATVQRAETDSDGVYEAHLLKADGSRVTVEVDKSFNVTSDETMGTPPGGAPAANGTSQSG